MLFADAGAVVGAVVRCQLLMIGTWIVMLIDVWMYTQPHVLLPGRLTQHVSDSWCHLMALYECVINGWLIHL